MIFTQLNFKFYLNINTNYGTVFIIKKKNVLYSRLANNTFKIILNVLIILNKLIWKDNNMQLFTFCRTDFVINT